MTFSGGGGSEKPLGRPEIEAFLGEFGSAANISLAGRNLRGVDLSQLDLQGINLREANLRGADLSGANLTNADLRGAELRDTYLRDANLSEANLSGANLQAADLRGVKISGINLHQANLYRADLSYSDFQDIDLSEANLKEAYLTCADLRGADLTGADLSGADLLEANLAGAYLLGANLSDITLSPSDLKDANLTTPKPKKSLGEGATLNLKVRFLQGRIEVGEVAETLTALSHLVDVAQFLVKDKLEDIPSALQNPVASQGMLITGIRLEAIAELDIKIESAPENLERALRTVFAALKEGDMAKAAADFVATLRPDLEQAARRLLVQMLQPSIAWLANPFNREISF
jgi:uncharacterized protein YjbI with pentapeptide repeats